MNHAVLQGRRMNIEILILILILIVMVIVIRFYNCYGDKNML